MNGGHPARLFVRLRFQATAWLITGVALLLAIAGLLYYGPAGTEVELTIFFVPLTLAGLFLNRIGLWVTAGMTLLAVLAEPLFGAAGIGGADLHANTWGDYVQFVIAFLVVAMLLDRFSVVLQDTFSTAEEQQLQLSRKNTESMKTRQALIERLSLDEAIIENLPGTFYVIDRDGKFLQWNRNLPATLGYTQEEMPGLNAIEMFDGEDRALIAGRIGEVFQKGFTTAEANLIAKDGRRIPYFFNGSRVMLGGKPYVAGIGIDRSEIDAANERVRALNDDLIERLERLRALREIDMAITGNLELEPAMEVILTQVMDRLHVDAAAILLYRPDTQALYFGAGHGFRTRLEFNKEVRLGEGIAGRVALQRKKVRFDDSAEIEAAFSRYEEIAPEDFTAYVAVPLVSKGRLQGVLELFHRSSLDADDDWDDFLTTLATQTALALDNAAMFDDLQRTNAELRRAYDTTIEGWGRALDLRDEETAGHSARVADLTLELARRMDVPEDELTNMRWGALLHDIGKMGIPDRILLKPGRLTEAELAIMQKHTVFAYDFLAPIPFLKDATDIPYSHHERWDGSGYPRGLAGEEIPLAARIFTVIDVYDALTSDRPYRNAWTHEQAMEHISAGAGTQFDPRVVAAFEEMMERPISAY